MSDTSNISDDFEPSAGPSTAEVTEISTHTLALLELRAKVEVKKYELKKLEEDLRIIEEVDLPRAMTNAGCQQYTLTNGAKVEVKDKYSAALQVKNKDAKLDIRIATLKKLGADDLIKHFVTIECAKGQEELAQRAVSALRALSNSAKVIDLEAVHAGTLTAWVKEKIAAGVTDLPLESLSVFHRRVADVILPNASRKRNEDEE